MEKIALLDKEINDYIKKTCWQERFAWDNESMQESEKVDKKLKNLHDFEVLFGVTKTPEWQTMDCLSYCHEAN